MMVAVTHDDYSHDLRDRLTRARLWRVVSALRNRERAEISTGFGGLLFMMSAVGYLALVIMLEAWPVYSVLSLKAKNLTARSAPRSQV